VEEFAVGGGRDGITAGPDGNVWFTEYDGNNIGFITPGALNPTITEFHLPNCGVSCAVGPTGITLGPDGNLWFTEYIRNRIGRITSSGTITEFPVTGAAPYLIT